MAHRKNQEGNSNFPLPKTSRNNRNLPGRPGRGGGNRGRHNFSDDGGQQSMSSKGYVPRAPWNGKRIKK